MGFFLVSKEDNTTLKNEKKPEKASRFFAIVQYVQ